MKTGFAWKRKSDDKKRFEEEDEVFGARNVIFAHQCDG